jgi:large subunit ribosomal protein L25
MPKAELLIIMLSNEINFTSGSERECGQGSNQKRKCNAGMVQVTYGRQPVHFQAETKAFSLFYTQMRTVAIDLMLKTYNVITLQDIQFHPVSDAILHIDFPN